MSIGAEWARERMSQEQQTRFTYRLLDPDGRTVGERLLPTDGEALAWADEVRGEGTGIVVLRVEREAEDGWVPVEEGGALGADRGAEDV